MAVGFNPNPTFEEVGISQKIEKGEELMPSTYSRKKGFTKAGKQRYEPNPKNYLYNIDTLWLNVGSEGYDSVMDIRLRDLLIAGRESYSDGEGESVIQCKLVDYENPITFKIMHGNPPLYQYSLRNDSMAIYFSKHERKGQLPMRVQLNQFLLWEKGVEGAYYEAICVLRALGFTPNEFKVNRVDFAVHSDQFEWNFEDMKKFEYPRNIKNDNKPNYYKLDAYTGEFGTMMHGDRSRLCIRIYNKSKEIEDKQKLYFKDLYKKHEMNVDNVWNIEIEVRRPFLKDLCEDDEELKKVFDDFNYCLANDGLSRLWTILMARYNHNSAHWRMLTKLDKHFKFDTVHGLTVSKDKQSNFEREVPQILGRLSSAVMTEEDDSLENAIRMLLKEIPNYEERQRKKGKEIITFEDRVRAKKSLIQNEFINSTITDKKKNSKIEIKRDLDHLQRVRDIYSSSQFESIKKQPTDEQ